MSLGSLLVSSQTASQIRMCACVCPYSGLLSLKGSGASAPEVVSSVCSCLNSSDLSMEVVLPLGQWLPLTHQNQQGRWREILCQPDGEAASGGWVSGENNSRGRFGHRMDRVRKEVWVRLVTVRGVLTAAAGEPGRKAESEPPGPRSGLHGGYGVPGSKGTSWGPELAGLFLLWGTSDQHLGGCDPVPVQSVSPGRVWWQFQARFCERYLQDDWSGCDLHRP